MSTAKTKNWPLAHTHVDLNTDTNLLKLVAMITMLIDHTGKMLFHSEIMRIIGRTAFPIYAYCIAAGCVYTKDHLKYLRRLVAVGLISQPFYALALDHTNSAMYAIAFRVNPVRAVLNFYIESWNHPSIFLTLTLGLLLIWTIREKQLVLTLALALFVYKATARIDYGWMGVLLIVLFYLFINKWWISLPVMFAYMAWLGLKGSGYHLFGINFGMQGFAIMILPLIYIHTKSNLKINKWVFYLFYPAHLIGMLLIEMAMKLM